MGEVPGFNPEDAKGRIEKAAKLIKGGQKYLKRKS